MAHDHSDINNKGLNAAFWLNACFTIIEVVGGIYTNSTAILTDAIHDFGDTLAIGIGILLEKVSTKKRSNTFSYGYKRFSLLSAIFLYVFLLFGAGFMFVNSIIKFFNIESVDSSGMFWLAVFGILINGLAYFRIKTSHSHSHGPNQNSKAIMLHFVEDVLGWLAILLGSAIIYFTDWYWIDPLLSILIAIFIIYNATKQLLSTMKIVLQAVPGDIDQDKLLLEIKAVNGVTNVHDLHIWSLDGEYVVSTLHLVVKNEVNVNQGNIRKKVSQILDKYGIDHPTIQIETSDEICQLSQC